MPATVNRGLACLKALFNHVLKADVPLRNPVSRVKFCGEHNEHTRVLTIAEQEKYLAKATPMLRDVWQDKGCPKACTPSPHRPGAF